MSMAAAYTPIIITASPDIPNRKGSFRRIRREMGWGNIPSVEALNRLRRESYLPEVLEFAREILKGNFTREQVEECDQGYRIKDPEMCRNLNIDLIDAEPQRDEARLTLISDLTRLGNRVALITLDSEEFEILNPEFVDKAKDAGVNEKDIIETHPPEGVGMYFPPSFPRDHFSQVGNQLYFNPDSYFDGRIFSWARRFVGMSRAMNLLDYSPIGHGGEVVVGNGTAFLGSKRVPYMHELSEQRQVFLRAREKQATKTAERDLQEMGFDTFVIPQGWVDLLPPYVLSELNTDKRFFILMDHADMNVMLHPQQNGLFFRESYYQEHRTLLDPIVEKIKPSIFRVLPEEDGLPVNSLVLPNGVVYMDAAAEQSVGILRGAGVKVETTSKPIGTWNWGNMGGIHCATNIINLPVTPTR
jgi:hypothetical protein